MKVAVYSGSIPSTTFVEHLINGLGASGVEVYLFGKVSKVYKPSHPNIQVFPTPANNFRMLFFVVSQSLRLFINDKKTFRKIPLIFKTNNVRSIPEKIKFLSRVLPILLNKPDVFHIQWVKALEDYYWVKSILNIRLVVSLRGAHINYSPLADKNLADKFRKYFPKVDVFHGVSDAIIKEGAKYGLITERATVIRPAVQRETVTATISMPPKREKLEILSVGRFHWKKGYHYALDAMVKLKKEEIDFHYTIVAGGEHEEIFYQVKTLQLDKHVSIVHGLPHSQVFNKMSQADLFLLPSVEEGIANVVLEAMATGTPVITTDCGGMTEVIQDQVNGFLVPVRNPNAIVDAVVAYSRLSSEDITSMKQRAIETILKNHLVENQVLAFKTLYEKALNQVGV